jgi:hypothetical protein
MSSPSCERAAERAVPPWRRKIRADRSGSPLSEWRMQSGRERVRYLDAVLVETALGYLKSGRS